MTVRSSDGATMDVARFDWKRLSFILLGVGLFAGIHLSPAWPDAVDPKGTHFVLSVEGKAAMALFLLAATYWVTEVVPIGITAIIIGMVQALFLIREPRVAFTDFMDPSVWFIFGSLTIGAVFTKTGLTKRIAYRMLSLVGERTSMILLGCFAMTTLLTFVMAHTAVAATVYPLFMAIYGLYTDDDRPTRFGKSLFIGMAFVAGAGSIVTLLGAARGAVALGFFREIVPAPHSDITFFGLTWYMLPIGVLMAILLWVFFLFWFPPEKRTIPGLRRRALDLHRELGPISRNEVVALALVVGVILILSLRAFVPALSGVNKSAIILMATSMFFLTKILTLEDLEDVPWNIILLFGGAMSIGFCLWQTGAAKWLAVHWLTLFQEAPGFVFIMGMAFFVLIMTNLIMNVAAIAISLPVALVIAPYLDVAPHVILFSSLVTAGMPFLLLVGAAPNAIAYSSKQFTTKEFFFAGIPASLLLMVVLALFVWLIWPLMGMPVTCSASPEICEY